MTVIRVAAAPISWGVCEVPGWGRVLDAPTVLGEMAALGVQATELGPPGYLPRDPAELRELLGTYGLTLVGVDYPPDDQLEARTKVTRDLRVVD